MDGDQDAGTHVREDMRLYTNADCRLVRSYDVWV